MPRARRFPSRPPPRNSASASIPRLVLVCRVGISRQETSSFPKARCETDRVSTKTSNNGGKMSRTIEAIMRHMAPPPSHVTDQSNRVEKMEKEITVKKRRSEEHTSELQSHLNLVCRL